MRVAVVWTCAGLLLAACGGVPPPDAAATSRTFRMGFSGIPPRADLDLTLAAVDMWSGRADAAIMSLEPPWEQLLAGMPVETHVRQEQLPLANYYRGKGHEVWFYLDPGNGLNRAGESDGLVRMGRSITEPDVQQLYRAYAVAVATIVRPQHLGLALETNLIRGASPPGLYAAIRQVVNDAAADVRARDPALKLSVSVQVDHAWGRLAGRAFEGVDKDFSDFPFVQELGLSSYPYLAGFAEPEDIPVDYYSRLVAGRNIPVAVTEGGWTSASLGPVASSPDKQRRYIVHQAALLDQVSAVAVFQLTFTDLDLAALVLPPDSILPAFAYLGLVDINLSPKPALSAWDSTFARTRRR